LVESVSASKRAISLAEATVLSLARPPAPLAAPADLAAADDEAVEDAV
jgi:hypothetical protein